MVLAMNCNLSRTVSNPNQLETICKSLKAIDQDQDSAKSIIIYLYMDSLHDLFSISYLKDPDVCSPKIHTKIGSDRLEEVRTLINDIFSNMYTIRYTEREQQTVYCDKNDSVTNRYTFRDPLTEPKRIPNEILDLNITKEISYTTSYNLYTELHWK